MADNPRESSVRNCGMDVYWREYGAGTPLLVLGGGPGDSPDRYLSLCETLAPIARCILVEQRGTGRSMPAPKDGSTVTVDLTLSDLEAVRKALGLDQWIAMGFSYGGYLASEYAAAYSGSVRSLILLDSCGIDDSCYSWFSDSIMSRLSAEALARYKFWEAKAGDPAVKTHAITEAIRAMLPGYFCDREKALETAEAIRDGDFDFETSALIDADIAKRGYGLAGSVNAYPGAVLILHGRQDPLGDSVPLALRDYYAPEARLHFIERAGHYSWIERPDEVKNAIEEFLP